MRSRRSHWQRRVGIVALVGGLCLASYGLGVSPAVAKDKDGDLSGLTQNWDKALAGAARFTVLAAFHNKAVRDNETGLVWETTPDSTSISEAPARFACLNKNVGGRKGWRLPSVVELASLVDPSVTTPPLLSVGHPFTNVQSASYFSVNSDRRSPRNVWAVSFINGIVDRGVPHPPATYAWCVRGGIMNAEAY